MECKTKVNKILTEWNDEFMQYAKELKSTTIDEEKRFTIVFDVDLFESKDKLKEYHNKYVGYSNISFVKENKNRIDLFL